jgi:DNA-directed RNA polymerase-5 subunit 1
MIHHETTLMSYLLVIFPWLSSHILSEDLYVGPDAVELPSEVVKRITFEEQVIDININRLQEVVDK